MNEAKVELHYQIFELIQDEVETEDFNRLKDASERWIVSATLQKITTISELLRQLDKQAIIGVGNYDKLIKLLDRLHLNKLKNDVEKKASEIAQLTEHEDTEAGEVDETVAGAVQSEPHGQPVGKTEKLTHATIAMTPRTGPTEKLVITPAPNQGHPMECDVKVSWRIESFRKVFDCLAICSGATAKVQGCQSEAEAVEHAMKKITPLLVGSGVNVQYRDKTWTT